MYNFPNQSYDEFELFLPKLEKLLVQYISTKYFDSNVE